MAKSRKGLGVNRYFNNIDTGTPPVEGAKPKLAQRPSRNQSVAMLPWDYIEVNPFQPRSDFDEDALNELADSIKVHGLIQPITVRRLNAKKYQLISGERRWRASQKADLKEIPAYIRTADDQSMHEMALVENIQRENLNAIEIAVTYQRLIEECDLTQDALSKRVGKKRTTITNYLRLLKLPPEIQLGLKSKKISMGHARALVGVEELTAQLAAYREVVQNDLSVRQTEQLASKYNEPSKKKKPEAVAKLSDDYKSVQKNLQSYLGTKVALKTNGKGKGQILIPFVSDEDLNRILELIEE